MEEVNPSRRRLMEIQSDKFAGGILYRLGATLTQAQVGVLLYTDEAGSKTHPPKSARLEAVASGWKQAQEQQRASFGDEPVRTETQVEPVQKNTPPSVSRLSFEPETVRVDGGTFQMGSNDGESDEKPMHRVTLSDFAIGKYEITVQQYMQFVNETKTHYPEWLEQGSNYNIKTGKDDHYKKLGDALQNSNNPIVGISWDDAVAYCEWLSQKTNKKYRLPTEAEWEYAARGGNKSSGYKYSGSNTIGDVAWLSDNASSQTHPVGQKQRNELGIYDMSGNVWEWCSDWYGTYNSSSQQNPTGAITGSDRVYRGGGWSNGAAYCRSAFRYNDTPTYRYSNVGFRVGSSLQ